MIKSHTFNCFEYIMSSLYDRLGVGKSASGDEIKKAYRDMARQHHPDKGGDTETFKGVQEAYEVLSDPSRKQMYDMTGSTSEQPQQQQQQRGPFPDIFSMFGGMHSVQKMRKERGPDSGTDPMLGLDAFYNGIDVNMNFKQKRKCESCRKAVQTCPNCGGAGMCVVNRQMGPLTMQSQQLCSGCRGLGQKHMKPCEACKNARYVEKEKAIATKIVPGMQPDHMVVFPGECSESDEYDVPGDVILKFRLAPSRYEWRGDDLHIAHTVTFADSILGFDVTLNDHPSRKTQVLKWSGGPVVHGTVLTIEGKGMPRKSGTGFGDIKLKINVTQPPMVPWTDEQRKALESVLR